jgi:hypothetical protein
MERASRCAGRSSAWPRPPVRTESPRPTAGALQCLGARVPGDRAVQDARVAFDLQRARRNSAVHGEDQLGCRTSSRGFSRLRRRLGGREPAEPSPLWRQVQSPGPSLRGVVVQDRAGVATARWWRCRSTGTPRPRRGPPRRGAVAVRRGRAGRRGCAPPPPAPGAEPPRRQSEVTESHPTRPSSRGPVRRPVATTPNA